MLFSVGVETRRATYFARQENETHFASAPEVERRSRASALRLLDDKTRTWQERRCMSMTVYCCYVYCHHYCYHDFVVYY